LAQRIKTLSDFGGGGCLIGEMHDKSDVQLLREYDENGDESAFREIVTRHTDLVYSSALRQAISPDLAQDIAQSVFTDLARKAQQLVKSLEHNASLLGWLFRSTRFTALNQLRDSRRRLARERQAMEILDSVPDSASEWESVRPVLDEAMADLSDEDRDALLLRFFKNQDFRAIGESLGVSDDAAQKRVSRATERLRAEFTRRGVTTTAVVLSTALSANAVAMAPAGLAATLASTALTGTTIAAATTATVTKAIAMTTLQKTIIASILIAAAGTGIYQAHQASTLRSQLATLQQPAPSDGQTQKLTRALNDATSQLAALRGDNERLNRDNLELLKLRGEVTQLRKAATESASTQADSREALMKAWLARFDKLKQVAAQNADKTIPELQLLSEQDWLNAARDAKFETDQDVRQTLANLRHMAENTFVSATSSAVSKYMKAHNGQFPTDLAQLQPYFDAPMDAAILQRWEIVPQTSVPNNNMGGDWVITEKAPVDRELDNRWAVGPGSYGSSSYVSAEISDAIAAIDPALKAYATANNGKQPTDPSQILPYLTTPEQQAAFQTLQRKSPTNAAPQ
jgi:RNA polymerase sigma factor (sigma-70 family)